MKMVIQALSSMLFVMFAENLVLSHGHGATELIFVAHRPKIALLDGAVLTAATTVCGIVYWFFERVVSRFEIIWPVHALLFMIVLAVLYLIFVGILRNVLTGIYIKVSRGLTVTLINSLVFSVPFIIAFEAHDFLDSVALGVGAGLSFIIAAVLLSAGQRALNNPDVPEVFKGLPVQLIYMGILSMVFYAFAVH